jgi:hypothetical protein
MAAVKAPAAPAMAVSGKAADASESTAVPRGEAATMVAAKATAMIATGAATVEGHRTGRHTCGESHNHRAREKLFSHQNLLHPIVHQYRLPNQRQPRTGGCKEGAAEQKNYRNQAGVTCAVYVGAMLELGDGTM